MTELDTHDYQAWIGKEEIKTDVLQPWQAQALADTLDQQNINLQIGDDLPPVWHWIYFLSSSKMSKLGYDGHSAKGSFLPPVPLPRRMWAGGRLQFLTPLKIGEQAQKRSTIADVKLKNGRTGQLAFVTVRHEITGSQGGHIVEEHDIVYREPSRADAPQPPPLPAPAQAQWSRTIEPSEVLLFRYSALTFNGHRIHYDRTFCTEQEGYQGLVVHAPLTATLLTDLVRENLPNKHIKHFSFRAVSPLFDIHNYTIEGRSEGNSAQVWALNHQGELAVTAEIELA